MLFRSILAALTLGLLSTPALADMYEPVTLAPVTHSDGTLAVIDASGAEVRYTPADLEQLDTYRMRTRTPWRDVPTEFDGVLLSDLLARHGLIDQSQIQIIAENDFVSSMPKSLWESVNVLIATRADGRPLSRRERGPILFVIHEDEFAASPQATEAHLVWMAARIEAE